MKREVFLSLAIAALMAAPALAQGADAPGGPGATVDGGGAAGGAGGGAGGRFRGGAGGGGQRARLEAVLNPQQREQYRQIMEQSRTEGRPLMQKMAAMRQQMQGGTNMDDKTKADFVAVRQQLKAHHEAMQAKINALLTADQKAQLEKTGGIPKFGEHGGGGGHGDWGNASDASNGAPGRRHGRHAGAAAGAGTGADSLATPPLPPANN